MELYYQDIRTITEARFRIFYHLADDARRAKCDACRLREDKLRCVAGDYLARTGLAKKYGVPPASIRFARTEDGKPYAIDLSAHFSISHSGHYVFCAVSDAPVGIDVEQMRPVKAKLTQKVCTPAEHAYIAEAPGWDEMLTGEAMVRFFEVWTSKEAYFKWAGTGITDLKAFDTLDHIRRGETFEHDGHMVSTYPGNRIFIL